MSKVSFIIPKKQQEQLWGMIDDYSETPPNYNKEESDKIVFELIDKLRHTIVFIIMTLIVSVKIINGCPYKRLKYGTNETLIASVVKFVRFFSSL